MWAQHLNLVVFTTYKQVTKLKELIGVHRFICNASMYENPELGLHGLLRLNISTTPLYTVQPQYELADVVFLKWNP